MQRLEGLRWELLVLSLPASLLSKAEMQEVLVDVELESGMD